jgi:hypothetical protein
MEFDSMNISKYVAFFHDGAIINIQHIKNTIEFSMASAEVDPEEDIIDDVILSKDASIQGKLHIEGVLAITINKKPFLGMLKNLYDRGKIFDFEITENSVELSIDWINFSPRLQINEFSVIQIKAKKIWWENIPDLIESS